MKTKQGFTLIELIVVITIIAVGTVVGLVSYANTNKKARDSRRMSDLEKIRIALEMAKQVGATYPPVSGGTPQNLTPDYIQVLPADPKSFSYHYVRPDAYHYYYCAHMEDASSVNDYASCGCGNSCGGLCNYCVASP